MIPKENIEEIILFCNVYNIPNIGNAINLYESIYYKNIDNYKNGNVARVEIMNEWKDIYQAYWDKNLIQALNKETEDFAKNRSNLKQYKTKSLLKINEEFDKDE